MHLARSKDLSGVALTDHDTFEGLAEAKAAADEVGLEFVPGIEFSAEYAGASLHILGYWVDPDDDPALRMLPSGPTSVPGNLSRVEVVQRYAQATGRDVSDVVFAYVFGLFKIAVIVQQIYARYARGSTRDPRFAGYDALVSALAQAAALAADSGRF
jgi:predicted metal-dependent phosphoesterase TrpH